MRTEKWSKKEFMVLMLRDLAAGGSPNDYGVEWYDGLCSIMDYMIDAGYETDGVSYNDQKYFSWLWEMIGEDYDFSIDRTFPVPEPEFTESQSGMFKRWSDERERFHRSYRVAPAFAFNRIEGHWEGEYGDNRRDYCEFVADWIEENL